MPLNIINAAEVGSTLLDPDLHPVPRDGRDRPLVVPKAGGKPVSLTRMTTHVDCIEDKTNLAKYGKRNVLIGAQAMGIELNQVRRLDPEDQKDKRVLDRMADRAEDLAGANVKSRRGTHLHKLSEHVDRGEALPSGLPESDLLDMAAYQMATLDMTMLHAERFVANHKIRAGGTPDRIVFYDGLDPDGEPAGNVIGDLKTGSVEHGALKMAMQEGGYSRGEWYNPGVFPVDVTDEAAFRKWRATKFDAELAATAYQPLPNVNQRWGLIFHLPAGTGECTVYWADLTTGWKGALLASRVRDMRTRKKVLTPFQ